MTYDILFKIYDIFSYMIYIFIIYQLLGVKVNFKKKILIILSVVLLNLSISINIDITAFVDKYITIFILIFILSVYRVSNIFQIFVCTVITINITLMINDIFLSSLITFMNTSSSTIFYNPMTFSLATMGFLVFDIIILVFLKKFNLTLFEEGIVYSFETINNKTKFWKRYINPYNMIVLVIVIQMWLLTMYFQSNESTMLKISPEIHSVQQDLRTLVLSTAIIILNIIVIFMVKNILISEKAQYQYKIKEKEFSQIQQQDKVIRQYKHDLSNHLKVIKILTEEEKYGELNKYVINYDEEVKSNSTKVKTGLVELDILLNSKITTAQSQNIIVKYKCVANIKCTSRHIINLISIIGNILDNAIEASGKSDIRIINIEIKENKLDYIFMIKNTTEDDELVDFDFLLKEGYSTKGENRGLGLSVVNRLVKKYNGNLIIRNEDDNFVIRIDLPKYELSRN